MLRTNFVRFLSIFVIGCILHCYGSNEMFDNAAAVNADEFLLPTLEFQLNGELIADNTIASITQAFSIGRESIALSIQGQQVLLYWNYQQGETYLVKPVGGQNVDPFFCEATPLDLVNPQTSVVQKDQLLIKPSVLLGFERSLLPKPITLTAVGKNRTRGLYTQIYTTTLAIEDIQAYALVTYHVLDAAQYPSTIQNSIRPIIRIDVDVRKNDGSKHDTYTYNIFNLNSSPSRRLLRQSLETPEGVYCQGRSRGFRVPENVPERVSANSELYIPKPYGLVVSSHGAYDTDSEIDRGSFRVPSFNDSTVVQHMSVLHDFLNGLSYLYDYQTRECSVHEIRMNSTDTSIVDGQPNVLEMATPRHFFLFDDAEYQYTGEKPCRDRFMCHVWIGEKKISDTQFERREWYWAISINGEPLRRWIPMKLNVKIYKDGLIDQTYNTVFYGYRPGSYSIYFEADYNLAECYKSLGPANNYNLATLSFRLNNDAGLDVMRNLNYLRFQAFESLIFGLRVRPIRISGVVIDQEGKDIVVSFTLIDAPPKRGPVENFYMESSLDEAIGHLKKAVDSGNFVIRGRANERQVLLHARSNSLNASPGSNNATSGPRITAFWIVFVVIGLLVGIVAGLLILKKVNPN